MYVFGKSLLRKMGADSSTAAGCAAPGFAVLTEGAGAFAFARSKASIFFASVIRSRGEGAAAAVAGLLVAVGG